MSDGSQKKPRLPYVPWYDGDFLRSTAGWSLMEKAVLWRLLCTQWESGPLPASMSRLAAIVGIQQIEFESIWGSIVEQKFVQTEKGLVNLRMETHREKYLKFRAKQAEGGKKGAQGRWKRSGKIVPFTPAPTTAELEAREVDRRLTGEANE